jgi:hypothetical protein
VIHFLVTRAHRYTADEYLGSWGRALASIVRVVAYGALPANAELPGGTYLFTDVERLSDAQRSLLGPVCDQLTAGGARVLNHPARALGRKPLLDRLHQLGKNRYRAFRIDDAGAPWRFPVFVRQEKEHTGSLTRLLRSEVELRDALRILLMEGFDRRDLLVVELCDTADAGGIYRKYSAFLVGGRILPRHVLFSRGWMLKDVDLLDDDHRREIREYVGDNPHAHELAALFAEAGVEYGRIDYALLDGAIQVWEINTNPIIVKPPEAYPEATLKFHGAFAERFNEAFATLDRPGGGRIPIRWSDG